MTDRGLPIVDGAPACPFVAFEDDRESRATSPDQRHRCYAEVRPAPRAQAHQDAYCLSSAFPLCPTFQEWARREAARVREEPPTEANPDQPTQRNPQRSWAAPPPWMCGGGQPGAGRPTVPPGFLAGQGRVDAGLAGSLAHRIAMDGAPVGQDIEPDPTPALLPEAEPILPPERPRAARGVESVAFSPLDEREVRSALEPDDDGWPLERAPREPEPSRRSAVPSRPLAPDRSWREPPEEDWDADRSDDVVPPDVSRWARPEDRGSGAAPVGAGRPVRQTGPLDDDEDGDEDESEEVRRPRSRGPAPGPVSRVGSLLPGDHRPKVGDTRPRRRSDELAGPSWERPRRYEAYPTLKTRIGLPAVPRVGILAIALLLAAVGLFFLPSLLGVGNPAGSPGPSGSAARTGAPSGSAAPSVVAAPTSQLYEVQPGDTMSKIATKFGVPLTQLVDANKDKYPNPDRLAIGDLLVIPAPVPTSFSDAAPTAAPATRTPAPSPR